MRISRDRHGRGIRGPLALPNALTRQAVRVPRPQSAADYFISCVSDSVRRIQLTCPDALLGVDVGVQEVPGNFAWRGAFGKGDQLEPPASVPLAAALDADAARPAQIVMYRRPLERRAEDRADLHDLVHYTLVEQLSALTTRPMNEIDPDIDPNF